MNDLPSSEQSYWRQAYAGSNYPRLNGTVEVDVAVVGGGITGLTAAYLLKRRGLTVAVLEKRTVGSGTTGRTTGKVTSQHNMMYTDLYERLGETVAQDYAEANQIAVKTVGSIIADERIDCDWDVQDNYVYTTDEHQVEAFRKEAEIAARLGLPATFVTDTPLPFETAGAVTFSGQGRMHAQKYLLGLAAVVNGDGSFVFENSNVTGIHEGTPCRVRTRRGSIRAKDVIVATNVPTLPLVARGMYCLYEYPQESYIVAGRFTGELPGMYISPDKQQYSILPVRDGGDQLLLIGGNGHLSGLRLSRRHHFERLAAYARQHFGIETIEYMWSDRDYLAYDRMPLVGPLYSWSKHLYVGTAYGKWGLSNGTAAAMMLTDAICEQPNPWVASFSSDERNRRTAAFPRAVKEYLKR